MITFSRLQHILWQATILTLIALNIYMFRSSGLGIILGLAFLWFNSKKLADVFFSHMHQGLRKTLGLFLILTYISIGYTLAYHFYKIDQYIFWGHLITIVALTEWLSWYSKKPHYFFYSRAKVPLSSLRQIILPSLVILSDLLLFIFLGQAASSGLIRSPWELLDYRFWSLLIFSNFCLAATIIAKKSHKNIWLIILHFFLLSSLAILLYPLGFGYDSFIHLAALRVIAETGSISPRLFLYIGQYGLTFFFHDLTQISLQTANKILLPLLFALFWPSSIFYSLKHGFNWTYKNSYLAVLWSLFIGFNFAIMTTPQSLAFLLVLFYICLLLLYQQRQVSLWLLWLVAISTLTIHPLGGLPLCFFNSYLSAGRLRRYALLRKILSALALLLAGWGLPLFFLFYELINNITLDKIIGLNAGPLVSLPPLQWQQSYSFPLDWLHNIGENQIWLYLMGVIAGLILIIKNHKQIFFHKIFIFGSLLILNYLLAKIFLTFSLQISYQKEDYLERMIFMIGLSALPIFLTAIFYAARSLLSSYDRWAKLGLIIVTVVMMSVNTYFSYPVYDRHANDKSFNVTATDIRTVEKIEEIAQGRSYIVLANQMVGAAAIYKYGFTHYYQGNFYYSMPLGTDNIYQNFLAMIEKEANRDEARRAMDKAGVNELYFVVNNYWHSAKTAIVQASQTADEKILIDNGVNTIFVYKR